MKKKVSIKAIVSVYDALDKATLGKMEKTEQFAFINALRPLKKVNTDFSDFRKDAVKRLQPEDYDEIVKTIDRFNAMTDAQKLEALDDSKVKDALDANGEFRKNLDECLREELDRETEVEYEPLSQEAFGRLMDSNSAWPAGTIMAAMDLLCE